jgi:hypothetical protein
VEEEIEGGVYFHERIFEPPYWMEVVPSPGGREKRIAVLLRDVITVLVPFRRRLLPAPILVPVIVNVIPPAVGPVVGWIETKVGASYENKSELES